MTDLTSPENRANLLNGLIGRDAFRQEYWGWLKSSGRYLAVQGIGGSGKSYILHKVGMDYSTRNDALLIEIDIGRTQNERQFVTHLANELKAAIPKNDLSSIAQKIERISVKKVKSCVWALFRDLYQNAKDRAPHLAEQFEQTAQNLDGANIGASDLEALDTDNLLYSMTEFIHFLSDLGVVVVICIDNFELAENGTAKAVDLLIRELPVDWKIVLAANTEITEKSEWVIRTRGQLRAGGGTIHTLGDLTDEDLFDWCVQFLGRPPTDAEKLKLIQMSERRTKKVREILADPKNLSAEPGYNSYSEIQERRRMALGKSARIIGNILSLATPDTNVSTDMLERIFLECGGEDFTVALIELDQAGFVERAKASVKLAHSSTYLEWNSALTTLERESLVNLIRSVLRGVDDQTLRLSDNKGIVRLAADAVRDEGDLGAIYEMGKFLLETGETSAGVELLEFEAQDDVSVREMTVDRIDQALLLATTYLSLGRYSAASSSIVLAETAGPKSKEQASQTHLLRLKHALRTNNFPTIKAEAKFIQRDYAEHIEVQVERALVENTAARDLLDIFTIEKTSGELSTFLNKVTDQELQCSILRALARSYAKLGRLDEALDLAQQALVLADDLSSVRALGNSEFAMAEVRRYRSELDFAHSHYERATKFAKGTNNRDALVWSILGSGFAYVAESNLERSQECVDEATKLVSEEGYLHPIEALHAQLLAAMVKNQTIERVEFEQIFDAYERMGIEWPRRLIADDVGNLDQTKVIPI